MIILPERNRPVGNFLMPLRKSQWIKPSGAQPKDTFGQEDQTRYRLRARLHDGHVAWVGWFDDREDFDAFLFAMAMGTLIHQPGLWELPSPAWHPGFDEVPSYDFATVTFLTASPGVNLTYTSPIDWSNTNNKVEVLGGGATGGAGGSTGIGYGGGGTAFAGIANFTFAVPGTTTATYNIANKQVRGGVAVTTDTQGGYAGNRSWFNGATFAAASVAADGGGRNNHGTWYAGGLAANCIGTTKFSGGDNGDAAAASASGGGGAAGPLGVGGKGLTAPANGHSGGGNSNGGFDAAQTGPSQHGNNGTYWDATHGCGSGAGGQINAGTSFNGGNYGGGGGGVGINWGFGTIFPGDGQQGMIVVTYTPASLRIMNMPMAGL